MVGSGFTSHFGVISEAGRFGRSVLETGRGSKSSITKDEFTTFSTKFRSLNLVRRLRGLGINLEVLISDVINQVRPLGLAAQDAGISSRRRRFESGRGYSTLS